MSRPKLKDLLPPHLKEGLTKAEKKLLKAAQEGEVADCRSGDPEIDKPENSDRWDESRTMRAEFLYWICTDTEATKIVHAKGVQVRGAKITGELDFQFATLSNPLGLFACMTEDGIDLRHANTNALSFHGSHTGSIIADGLETKGGVFLNKGFKAKGCVSLIGAEIDGDLDCSNGFFENKKGNALSADRLKTKGTVFLDQGFEAKGEVRFLGAQIGGNLDCSNGIFENEKGNALSTDGFKTNGTVFLNQGFKAKGAVRFLNAEIGGNLACSNGFFENKKGAALSADGLKTKGGVFLDEGFEAKGCVRLLGAEVGGNLDCRKGIFENKKGVALCAEGMMVDGVFFWLTKKKPVGMIDLFRARVGQLIDNKDSWPEKDKLYLDGFEYGALEHTSAEVRLEWIRLQPDKPFKPQPYEQLARVLRKMGHEKDARKVLVAKKKDLWRYGKLNWYEKTENRLLDIFIGYGWKPWNAIIFFLLLGSGVFWCADTRLQVMQPSKERVFMSQEFKESGAVPSTYPKFSPLVFSVDVFVPFLNLHQENFWLPDASKPYGRWFRWYFWLHIILGWGLSTWLAFMLTTLFTRSLE